MMSKEMNDLFFVCSMIEKVSRESKQKQSYVINRIGKENIRRLYRYADVFHCENPDKISYELIENNNIDIGTYDKISRLKYKVPTYWEIGEIYARLMKGFIMHHLRPIEDIDYWLVMVQFYSYIIVRNLEIHMVI